MELPKTYIPQDYEEKIYKLWEKSGAFTPKIVNRQTPDVRGKENSPDDQRPTTNDLPFVIMMPPPNVTGKLHIGHAMFVTLEDILTRYHRMRGETTLWLPGTDHAGIATQNVVEKELKKEGLRKEDLGREKFVERVWQWKEKYGNEILSQIKHLGASCDWTRERFTLDEGLSEAVNVAFKRLYDKGLIYQGLRTVNWCPRCQTAIADDEVEHKTQKGKFYYFKYDKNFPITIATTRPETKLGDVAVAVNPKDNRYKKFVGKTYKINLDGIEREIKIIADQAVDPKFGTGAVGVTPAHSYIDWQMAQANNLPIIPVINEFARMTKKAGKYEGLKVSEAREKLVEYLKANNLLEKEEEIENNLATCYRCGGQIEPIASKQWFVKMKPLAEKAREAVKSGEIKIVPKRFEKIYFHWLDNIRDWCISRQLWWGHRIPVYYRKQENDKTTMSNDEKLEISHSDLDISKNNLYVGSNPPGNPDEWIQDPDVLDTWFSSSLWPFSTLGWPNEQSKDYKYFYPTTVMETGYDILFFWVARMIMMGLELTGKAPFKIVYLHGLVRDEHNRKMSKSLGNGIDPLEVSKKYGTDAVRMSLVVGATAGNDIAVGEAKIKGYRNFSNKLWNIARFVLSNIENLELRIQAEDLKNIHHSKIAFSKQDLQDLKKLDEVVKTVTKHLNNMQFSRAGELLYNYSWHEFADKIIEQSKDRLKADNEDSQAAAAKLLLIMRTILKMLHPFIPFVTETIWQNLPNELKDEKLLISAKWPQAIM